MGDRSLQACVQEQLDALHEALRLQGVSCGETLDTWYDAGAPMLVFVGLDDEVFEAAMYAWGYLNGAADHCDVTVREYVDNLGLSFHREPPTPPNPRRKQKQR